MSTSNKFSLISVLDQLEFEDLQKVESAVSNINDVYRIENKMLQQYISRSEVVSENPNLGEGNETGAFLKKYVKTAQEQQKMLRDLTDQILQCIDAQHIMKNEHNSVFTSKIELKNNVMEKELAASLHELNEIEKQADIKSNTYIKQILHFEDKIKNVQSIIDEFKENPETFQNDSTFDQWLINQVKHNQYLESKIRNEIKDYEQHTGKIKKEIRKLKFLPVAKPINVITAHHKIERIEKENHLILKNKLRCAKENFNRKRAIIELNRKKFQYKIEDTKCQQELIKLKEKLKYFEEKLVTKINRLNDLRRAKEEEIRKGPLFRENITFCGLIAQREQIRNNQKTIQCLKKKREKDDRELV